MIRVLRIYVLHELLAAVVVALSIILTLVLMGLTLQLVHKGIDVADVGPFLPYLLLYAVPHVLPAALLTGGVMVFGRLSRDNETTAVRASGIHLRVLVTPVILAALVLSMLSLQLNCNVKPRAYFGATRLRYAAGARLGRARLRTWRQITVPPYHIRVGKVEGEKAVDVTIHEYDADYVKRVLWAREALIIEDDETNGILLVLRDGHACETGYRRPDQMRTYTFNEIRMPVTDQRSTEAQPRKCKHMDMAQLMRHRSQCRKDVAAHTEPFPDPRKTEKTTIRKIGDLNVQIGAIGPEHSRLSAAIHEARGDIARAHATIDAARLTVTQAEQRLDAAKAASGIKQRRVGRPKEQGAPDAKPTERPQPQPVEASQEEIEKLKQAIREARDKASQAQESIAKLRQTEMNLKRKRKQGWQRAEALMDQKAQIEHIHRAAAAQLDLRDIAAEVHQRVGLAFSCLSFMLVAVPLGMLAKRGDIMAGLGASFLVVLLIYYPLAAAARTLVTDKYWPIAPLIWTPNAALAAIGVVLLWRIMRR